jgi:uncharacterized protein (TIGR02145 family)
MQRPDESGLIDIYFDLEGSVDSYVINIEVSFNDGENYFVLPRDYLSGDIGPMSPGNNKHIVWNGMESFPDRYSNETKLMLVANSIGSINPCAETPTVTDIDGNVYNTIQIGDQCWMRENLRVTRYRDGSEILDNLCWYDDDISNKYIYGGLYRRTAVNNTGICPEGWKIPIEETTDYHDFLANIPGGSSTGGRAVKSCRQVGSPLGGNCDTTEHPRWDEHESIYGTNETGFTALPAGYRSNNEYFNLGIESRIWTRRTWSGQHYIMLNYESNAVSFPWVNTSASIWMSIRCIKE